MPDLFRALFFRQIVPFFASSRWRFLNPTTVLSAPPQSVTIQRARHSASTLARRRIYLGDSPDIVPRLRTGSGLFLACLLFNLLCPLSLWAGPTFLNRQGFPLRLGLPEIGRFHTNDLKTFEVWTQWSNPTHQKIVVTVNFIFFDRDAADSQSGEDGVDDRLMTVTETFTIPEQVNNWGKYFQLTAIGHKLNEGFDHPEEGNVLELFVDAQIMSIQHLPSD